MRVEWSSVADKSADSLDGKIIEISGWPSTAKPAADATYVLMSPEPICCSTCLPSDPLACVEVFAAAPLSLRDGALTLRGTWRLLRSDTHGWRYQLTEASPVAKGSKPARLDGPVNLMRRQMLAGAPLICLGWTEPQETRKDIDRRFERREAARSLLRPHPTTDIHSHAGAILQVTQDDGQAPFTPLVDPMRQGGLAITCLAVVSDSPTHRVSEEGRIRAFRTPAPGELKAYAERGFRRLHSLVSQQGLKLIRSRAALSTACSLEPSVLVSAEGADFLEGNLAVLETAYSAGVLRHLQLTHYRVNELGDIQTEAPVHGGLTPFGADVIKACERLGIVVDLAHGTYDLVRQAVSVATKPLVLSHTSLASHPKSRTRLVTAEHAKLVSSTGGVIGIWPPKVLFSDIAALAEGMARMADVVGANHVGLGTDMMGLIGYSVIPGYELILDLAAELMQRFNPSETIAILGGNYVRVANACLE